MIPDREYVQVLPLLAQRLHPGMRRSQVTLRARHASHFVVNGIQREPKCSSAALTAYSACSPVLSGIAEVEVGCYLPTRKIERSLFGTLSNPSRTLEMPVAISANQWPVSHRAQRHSEGKNGGGIWTCCQLQRHIRLVATWQQMYPSITMRSQIRLIHLAQIRGRLPQHKDIARKTPSWNCLNHCCKPQQRYLSTQRPARMTRSPPPIAICGAGPGGKTKDDLQAYDPG